jgi:inorganic triphosphatase YgiF
MNNSQCALSFAELNQRLHRDEEWLKDFQEALNKSNQIQQSVCTLLYSFQERIDSLSSNVATLYTKSSVIQREQQNIRKLLSTVDATIQFHGKTTALENTIRDGNVMLSLDDYLEKMRTLKEAIAFFSTHLTYKNKLEHVKLIYEIGYSNIEAEFSNLVRYSCVAVDAKKLFECLDDDYELPSFRLDSFMTLRDVQKIHQIASWLIEHSDPSGERLFLHSYSQFRAENMMKPLQFIADQIGPNNRVKNAQFVKTTKSCS